MIHDVLNSPLPIPRAIVHPAQYSCNSTLSVLFEPAFNPAQTGGHSVHSYAVIIISSATQIYSLIMLVYGSCTVCASLGPYLHVCCHTQETR